MTKKLLGALGVAALMMAAAPSPAAAEEVHQVFMMYGQFCNDPTCAPQSGSQDTRISVGDSVEWVFADAACFVFDVVFGQILCYHDVRSASGAPARFSSPPMPTSGKISYKFKFRTAGTYEYFCSLHVGPTGMKARIIVG